MKTIAYGILVDKHLILQKMHFNEKTANEAAHQENYDRFYRDDIKLVKCEINYEVIKQISDKGSQKLFPGKTPKFKRVKTRKKLGKRKRLKGRK